MRKAWLIFAGLGTALAGVCIITCVGDASVAPVFDAGLVDGSNSTDSGGSGDASSCANRTVDEIGGVFVNINGMDSAQCGSATSPCQTIQAGVNQAKVLTRKTVFVARGTYKETVTLNAAITIMGGWDTISGKWIPACGADLINAVKIQMPDAANVAIKADFNGAATLRYLSVIGKTAAPTPGQSVYGVFAHNCSLSFESVSVNVGPGGVGGDGDAGATGGIGGIKCVTGVGATGKTGSVGNGADGGSFDPTGYVGTNGSVGVKDSLPGDTGSCTAKCGGNEFTTCKPNTVNCSASNGCVNKLAGCGGGPGEPGIGGSGGGASIGVFGWDATFSLSGGSFIGGAAGNGGNGGKGGSGGMGGAGASENEGCAQCINGNSCASVGNMTAAVGGQGGAGGPGGIGGGGSGGPSYGLYAGGQKALITVVTAPLFQHGNAGMGGTPSGSPGATGDRFPP